MDVPNLQDIELMRVMSDRLNRMMSLEELLDGSMRVLNRYLGWENMILLLADSRSQTFVTHASFGYAEGGVGSEVKFGQGLIGACASRERLFQISGMREAFRYSQAIIRSSEESKKSTKIPLPGLQNPASQLATPIMSRGELLGVLVIESDKKTAWDCRDQVFISVVTNILGMGIRTFNETESIDALSSEATSIATDGASRVWNYRFVEGDEMMFVNDQYLIRNIPAKILKYLLEIYLKTKRTDFSNLELRAAKELNLPEIKDNLEARLILLRKRLKEYSSGIQIRSTGRGKFCLEISGQLSLKNRD